MKAIKSTLTLILFMLPFSLLYAQNGNGLTVKGIVTHENRPLKDARVRIFNGNNQVVKDKRSKPDGFFRLRLPLDGYYVLEFSKKGMVHKRLLFRTHTPDHNKAYHPFDIEVILYDQDRVLKHPDLDLDLLLGIIEYDEEQGDFDYVEDYTLQRLKEQLKLLSEEKDS